MEMALRACLILSGLFRFAGYNPDVWTLVCTRQTDAFGARIAEIAKILYLKMGCSFIGFVRGVIVKYDYSMECLHFPLEPDTNDQIVK